MFIESSPPRLPAYFLHYCRKQFAYPPSISALALCKLVFSSIVQMIICDVLVHFVLVTYHLTMA